jgi:hypothetical protein
MDEKLKYVLVLAFVLNSAFVSTNFQDRTFDSYEHIFFANHYRTSWFNTWEPKWYGGFTVTSYPPLAHQSVALMSYAVGLEWAYKILTLVLLSIFPLAIYSFSKIFGTEKAAIYAALLSVFIPSVLQAAYSFGQFPTIFGLVAGLFTIVYFNKFLVGGNKLDLAIALGLLGVSVSTHHFTAIFLIPILVVVLILDNLVRQKQVPAKVLLKRTLLFSAVGIAICLVVIYPYWHFALFDSIKMTPIPHLSRANVLSDQLAFELFFWNMYGPILALIPLLFILIAKNKRLSPLFFAAFVLFVLGLGAATPLPQLMLGQFGEVLTYDRFSLWAGIMFLPLCGKLFAQYQSKIETKKLYKIMIVLFFGTLVLTSFYASNRSLNETRGVSTASMDPVIEFLNSPQTKNWNYLTLGLGEPAMLRLSTYGCANNVDGYYFFVRSDPLLAESGIGQLDAAKYYGDKGITILNEVLSNSSKYGLRWIICGDPTYNQILRNNRFVEKWSQVLTGDIRYGWVTIWEYVGLVQDYNPGKPKEEPLLNSYIWGIGPVLVLLITFLLFIIKEIKKSRSKIEYATLENLGNKK